MASKMTRIHSFTKPFFNEFCLLSFRPKTIYDRTIMMNKNNSMSQIL